MSVKVVSGVHAPISNRLRAVRAVMQMNQKDFAEGAGIAQKSYNLYEAGTHRISIPNAIRLRETYGITLDFIYCGSLDTLPHTIAVALASNPAVNASSTSNVIPLS